MQSRMDKYMVKEPTKYERTKKNTKLYEEVYDDLYKDTTYQNMEVIDSAKEININRLKDMLDDKYDTRQYRTFKKYDVDDVDLIEEPLISRRENKSYDINEIINEAKNKRTFIEEAKEKQKYIDFTKGRDSKYAKKYDDIKKDEEELEELINTMVVPKEKVDSDTNDALDLLSDLKGEENTIVTNPIDTSFDTQEKSKTMTNELSKTIAKADRTFYTDSNMFTKNDFEDFSTLTRELTKKSGKKKIFIIILVLIVLAVIAYLVITNIIIK